MDEMGLNHMYFRSDTRRTKSHPPMTLSLGASSFVGQVD
jgi:hypothetical protein